MTDFEGKIRERREKKKQGIDRKIAQIQDGVDNTKDLHLSLSIKERSLGIYCLVVGERVEAKHWFTESTIHTLETVAQYREYCRENGSRTWENEPLLTRDAFYTALLSQDEPTILGVVDVANAVPDAYLDQYHGTRAWYDFVLTLAAYLDGDETYRGHLNDLSEYADVFDDEGALLHRGIATAIEGIETEDEGQIADGIADMIPNHETENDVGSPKANALVCRPAAAMYVLALMHGLDPDIDREYVPEALDDSYVELHY